MREYESGAYIVSRRSGGRSGRNKRPRRSGGGAALLFAVLIFLTVAICLLIVFLPKIKFGEKTVSGTPTFSGKTFYALAVGESDDYKTAAVFATDTANRGGAGYLYNSGSYSAIAAVYERESDAKALAELNENAHYFSVSLPKTSCGEGDKAVLDYLAGDFFGAVDTAAVELDRGNATEAAADYAVKNAFKKLLILGQNAESESLKIAIEQTCDYNLQNAGNRTVLSYIRFMTVRVILTVKESMTV